VVNSTLVFSKISQRCFIDNIGEENSKKYGAMYEHLFSDVIFEDIRFQ